MRYIQLTSAQSQQLGQLYKISPDHRERQQAQALLLSQRGYTIPDLAELFDVDRDIIGRWIDRWQDWLTNTQQPLRLLDQAHQGRPFNLPPDCPTHSPAVEKIR